MRNIQQGEVFQLFALVAMMEHQNAKGANYSLDIMILTDVGHISYFDIRSDGVLVKGTLYNSSGIKEAAVDTPAYRVVPFQQENVDIDPRMVVEFEHYANVFDGIRCCFHKVGKQQEEEYYYHHAC